jgi:organic hydroperoxide reductase OsmC/OhrA
MDLKAKEYPYSTSLRWTGERKGALSCDGKPDIQVACPPEYGGHEGIWSPEDLFLASVEVCVMTTFLWLAGKEGIEIASYNSNAESIASMVDGEFRMGRVKVQVSVGLLREEDAPSVERSLENVERSCLISRSINPLVEIVPSIFVEKRGPTQ